MNINEINMTNIETGTFRSRKINDASSVLTEQISDEENLQGPEGKIFKLPPHLPKNASDFRIFIYEVTESKSFGGAILFVILLNTVILVAQTSESLVMKGGKSRFQSKICQRIVFPELLNKMSLKF